MPKRTHGIDLLDVRILSQLRTSARVPLRTLAASVDAPASTVYARILELQKRVVTRFTCLLDVPSLYPIHAWLWIGITPSDTECLRYLRVHPTFNTLCRLGPQNRYVAEGFFSCLADVDHECDVLRKRGARTITVRYVTHSMKRETTLTTAVF